jgi:rare lipoprotein A
MEIFVAYTLKISFTMRMKLAILLCFLYFTVTAEDAPEVGLASVYPAKFQGKITASGEQFNHQAISASHRRFPFGALVKITRVDNGKSIVVRINDRGPFFDEYVTNLSSAAAQKLGMDNDDAVKVKMEELNSANIDSPVTVAPESRPLRPAVRRQNQAPAPAPKSEPLPELTPKSIHPRYVPNNSNPRSYSIGPSQKKSLR